MIAQCKINKDVICHRCRKSGHLQKACRVEPRSGLVKKSRNMRAQAVCQVHEESDEDQYTDVVFQANGTRVPPIQVDLTIDGQEVTMEIDTGASASLMSENLFRRLWPGRSLKTTEVKLCSYSKQNIPVVGCCHVNIVYKGLEYPQLPLIVVKGSGPSLFGREWLNLVKLDWKEMLEINQVQNDSLQTLLLRYPNVFMEGLGTLIGYKAKIYVDEAAKPKFCQARSVPYALRNKVDEELVRLQEEGTIEPVEWADWAAPIVPVLKRDKSSVRICGDFRLTVNPVSKLDKYPIPKIEDLFNQLEKGKYYTKLDLSQAYQQISLEEHSKKYVVINTHKGLFQYTRLPFGISSAPGIFQRVIESLLKGVRGVVVYLDDILISGKTQAEHLKTLEEVLKRLSEAGLRVKKEKCTFLQTSVEYLGHRIDESGLHPLKDKVRAIKEAPIPQSVHELKAYLGLLSYYSKFLPNLSTTLHPLYRLLRKDHPWDWSGDQQKAFEASKELLTSDRFVTHFDSNLKLILACDASAYGVGAVLAHQMADGTEKPIGYASRTLSKAERNYSQLEKEGLACIFGVKKFHDYVFGHPFELITDHKPLLGLFKENRGTSQQASARIKRWSLLLSEYEYTLNFRTTTKHANADALSRLPLPVVPKPSDVPPELVLLTEHLNNSPVTAHDIKVWTRRDNELARVFQFVAQGWPEVVDPELKIFHTKQEELSIHEGCILWGTRVVVPKQGREAVLQELHQGHPGISRMKSLARMYVWWPGLDKDIEKLLHGCTKCQEVSSVPPPAPLNPWKWPTRPWARLHLDFAGPFEGRLFLIMIDAHSKWIEAVSTHSTSSAVVIEELRSVFARFGIPEMIVTDNGTGFVSQEFKSFLEKNGVRHVTSAPYHPASNGLAERAVQVIKKGLKKVSEGSIKERLAKVLLSYRITPHTTTGTSPSELLLGRRPRTVLDLLKPHTAENIEARQEKQKQRFDQRAKDRVFKIGDKIYYYNHGSGNKWLPGQITKVTGPVSFHVVLDDGRHKRCHQNQLKFRETPVMEADNYDDIPVVSADTEAVPEVVPATNTGTTTEQQDDVELTQTHTNPTLMGNRYPRRDRQPRQFTEPVVSHW